MLYHTGNYRELLEIVADDDSLVHSFYFRQLFTRNSCLMPEHLISSEFPMMTVFYLTSSVYSPNELLTLFVNVKSFDIVMSFTRQPTGVVCQKNIDAGC